MDKKELKDKELDAIAAAGSKAPKSPAPLSCLSRCEPTKEVGGMPVNDNVDLEKEADVMGKRFSE